MRCHAKIDRSQRDVVEWKIAALRILQKSTMLQSLHTLKSSLCRALTREITTAYRVGRNQGHFHYYVSNSFKTHVRGSGYYCGLSPGQQQGHFSIAISQLKSFPALWRKQNARLISASLSAAGHWRKDGGGRDRSWCTVRSV